MQPAGVRSIAVLRANAVGDMVFTLPALSALRNAFPQASIVLLGKRWHREFLAGRPAYADRVEVVPPVPGVTVRPDEDRAHDLDDWLRSQQERGYDVAVQLHGGGRFSNPLVKRLGAKLTVGLQDFDAPPLDVSVPYVYYQNETLRGLEVVATLGAYADSPAAELRALPAERREAQRVLPTASRPIAVLHPGASDARRRWPIDRFARIAEALWDRGLQPVATGSPDEADLGAALSGLTHCPVLNIAGTVSLGGLIGVLERAALVVSNDTGPLHLATALGTPTVGIFWCVNEINSGFPWRRSHRPVISWTTQCPVCGRGLLPVSPGGERLGGCSHNDSLLVDIEIGHVLSAVESLLDNAPEVAALK